MLQMYELEQWYPNDKPGKFQANVHVEIPTLWIVAMALGAASCMVITAVIALVLVTRNSG